MISWKLLVHDATKFVIYVYQLITVEIPFQLHNIIAINTHKNNITDQLYKDTNNITNNTSSILYM